MKTVSFNVSIENRYNEMAADFFLENRQDLINVSDSFYIFIAALGAFIGQLISVSLGKWQM